MDELLPFGGRGRRTILVPALAPRHDEQRTWIVCDVRSEQGERGDDEQGEDDAPRIGGVRARARMILWTHTETCTC